MVKKGPRKITFKAANPFLCFFVLFFYFFLFFLMLFHKRSWILLLLMVVYYFPHLWFPHFGCFDVLLLRCLVCGHFDLIDVNCKSQLNRKGKEKGFFFFKSKKKPKIFECGLCRAQQILGTIGNDTKHQVACKNPWSWR